MAGNICDQLVGSIYSGADFKKIAAENGWELVKYLPFNDFDKSKGKNDFAYKIGINTPGEKVCLNPNIDCSGGGLYFTWSGSERWYRDHCFLVSVPDDAKVLVERAKKFKTDKLEILREVDEQWYISHIEEHGYWLQNIKNQTPEICLTAVMTHGMALRYVKEQTPEICLEAVMQCKFAATHVKNM